MCLCRVDHKETDLLAVTPDKVVLGYKVFRLDAAGALWSLYNQFRVQFPTGGWVANPLGVNWVYGKRGMEYQAGFHVAHSLTYAQHLQSTCRIDRREGYKLVIRRVELRQLTAVGRQWSRDSFGDYRAVRTWVGQSIRVGTENVGEVL